MVPMVTSTLALWLSVRIFGLSTPFGPYPLSACTTTAENTNYILFKTMFTAPNSSSSSYVSDDDSHSSTALRSAGLVKNPQSPNYTTIPNYCRIPGVPISVQARILIAFFLSDACLLALGRCAP